MQLRKVTIRVPATTANLGPGYDCLGMALGFSMSLSLERSASFSIAIVGEGEGRLSTSKDNLVYTSAVRAYKEMKRAVPRLALRSHNTIPLNRGLGSSSAAIVAGLFAANALEGAPLSNEILLSLATDIEGHPDNVAPALLGGLQVVVKDGKRVISTSSPVKRGLKAVIFIPEVELATKKARAILPPQVSREVAVYNAGRTALLVTALAQGKWETLKIATQDKLHQPQRQKLMPHMAPVIEAALGAGAHGAFLSGAGPTILALASEKTQKIEFSMFAAARRLGLTGICRTVTIAGPGAQVTSSTSVS